MPSSPSRSAAIVAASGHLIPAPESGLFTPLAILLGGIGALILLNGYRARGRFGSILSTVAIALFIGSALFMATSVRNGAEDGRAMILFLIAITFATDTGAYLVGKAIGRHKMAPRVSPNKTWEGAAGGLLAAGATGVIFIWVVSEFQPVIWDLIATFAVGTVLGVTGQFRGPVRIEVEAAGGVRRFRVHRSWTRRSVGQAGLADVQLVGVWAGDGGGGCAAAGVVFPQGCLLCMIEFMGATKKMLAVLGSTGSVGTQTLDVVRALPRRFGVAGLSCKSQPGDAGAADPRVRAVADQLQRQRSGEGGAASERLARLRAGRTGYGRRR